MHGLNQDICRTKIFGKVPYLGYFKIFKYVLQKRFAPSPSLGIAKVKLIKGLNTRQSDLFAWEP